MKIKETIKESMKETIKETVDRKDILIVNIKNEFDKLGLSFIWKMNHVDKSTFNVSKNRYYDIKKK